MPVWAGTRDSVSDAGSRTMQTIHFYAPQDAHQPLLFHDYTTWNGAHGNFVGWVAQTYFYLKRLGFNCVPARTIPDEGILLTDWDTMNQFFRPLDRVMLVSARSDGMYHPSAHFNILHNPSVCERDRHSIWNPHFVPHWPMPGLMRRNPNRGVTPRTVAYVGHPSQLAPELQAPEWAQRLGSIGLEWRNIGDPSLWHDLSAVDIIVAARKFDGHPYLGKGANKLFNAWHAGIPAVLSPEVGFLAERRSDLDFLLARTVDEAFESVKRLKESPDLYRDMVANGTVRSKDHSIEKTADRWVDFFNNVAFPEYPRWSASSLAWKRSLYLRRYTAFRLTRIRMRIRALLGKDQYR